MLNRKPIAAGARDEAERSRMRRKNDPTYHLYGTAQWKKLRAQHLLLEPLCALCKMDGIVTPATVCDHITPHKGNIEAFWAGPFQSLCASHHSSDKQRIENGNKPRPRIGLDGWPV